MGSNSNAMSSIFKDTIFSNVALTPDGGVWWEGMGPKPKTCIDWRGKPWRASSSTPAAHPNSRFCTPLVKWFRRSHDGGLLWPGFGDNIRVPEWALSRSAGMLPASGRCVGWVPTHDGLDLDGLEESPDMEALFSTPTRFWREEAAEIRNYFKSEIGDCLPTEMWKQLDKLDKRIEMFADYNVDDDKYQD